MVMEIGSRQDVKGEDGNFTQEEEDTTLDWRGRASNPSKHGGMKAAIFVLGLQGFEIMGIAGVGNNLITYVINEMHFSVSKSANVVTNFVGTIFLLALLGGYLADSFLGSFFTALIFAFLELSGFILLSVQAHIPQLKPPKCNMQLVDNKCEEAKGIKALIFYVALYLVALGSGCVKPNMIAHGADQFNQTNPKHSKHLSTYFNAAYFAFSIGELIALTLLVWVQTHSGMDLGFGISAIAMALGLISLLSGTIFYRNKPPQGSIFTPISQVFVAAFVKRKLEIPSDPRQLHGSNTVRSHPLRHTNRFRFLDKACIKIDNGENTKESPWRLCTTTQVDQVKTLISTIPIFASTIIFNTILAQLQTFSVQQGATMNTKLTNSFNVPPASLQSIPYMILIFILPLYDVVLVPFIARLTGNPNGISPLRRIGLGLFFSIFSMISAALIENKRRRSEEMLSIFWITPQFVIFGFSEMLTAVGLIEFFYKISSAGDMKLQSFATAVTYCSYSFGFYLSSVLVTLVNRVTSVDSNRGWLSDNNLNNDQLDLFYWLLAVLSSINFVNYLFWVKWFSRNQSLPEQSIGSTKVAGDDEINKV